MENNYLAIMEQSLAKKEQVLEAIMQLNIRQKAELETPELTPEQFDETVEEKAKLIETLEQLDSGFEKLYARVKEELQGHKDEYKEEIQQMQQHIRNITDKSMQIQSQEARNKDLMTKKFQEVRIQARNVRTNTKVASQYYKNMMQTGYYSSQLMDDKK